MVVGHERSSGPEHRRRGDDAPPREQPEPEAVGEQGDSANRCVQPSRYRLVADHIEPAYGKQFDHSQYPEPSIGPESHRAASSTKSECGKYPDTERDTGEMKIPTHGAYR